MTATTVPCTALDLDGAHLPLREPTDVILIERLLRAVATNVDLTTLTRVINRSRVDLAGSPPGAMPELLERLVRQRLS